MRSDDVNHVPDQAGAPNWPGTWFSSSKDQEEERRRSSSRRAVAEARLLRALRTHVGIDSCGRAGRSVRPLGAQRRQLTPRKGKIKSPDIRRHEKIVTASFSLVRPPGGPYRVPGPTKNNPGRKTGPGEGVESSGARALKKS